MWADYMDQRLKIFWSYSECECKCHVYIPFMLKAILRNLSAFLCWHDLTDHQCKQNILKGSNFMLTDFKSEDVES